MTPAQVQVRSLIQADAAVAALIGNRIDWGELPADLPAAVLTVIDAAPVYRLNAPGSNVGSIDVQCDVYARNYGVAQAVADAIEAAISGRAPAAPPVQWIGVERRRHSFEKGTARDDRLHRVSLDLTIRWRGTT